MDLTRGASRIMSIFIMLILLNGISHVDAIFGHGRRQPQSKPTTPTTAASVPPADVAQKSAGAARASEAYSSVLCHKPFPENDWQELLKSTNQKFDLIIKKFDINFGAEEASARRRQLFEQAGWFIQGFKELYIRFYQCGKDCELFRDLQARLETLEAVKANPKIEPKKGEKNPSNKGGWIGWPKGPKGNRYEISARDR